MDDSDCLRNLILLSNALSLSLSVSYQVEELVVVVLVVSCLETVECLIRSRRALLSLTVLQGT